MKRIVGVVVAALLAGAATAQMPAQAWEPYSPALIARAQGGETAAQFALAEAFRTGNGTAPDRDQAIAWYQRCASADPRAADSLGVLLFTKGERKAAIPLLQSAAARQNAYALYILGTARFNGDYVPRDIARAYADMKVAAQTLPQAQRSLAMMEPYVGPDDRARAGQFALQPGGAEAGAPAAPDYVTAPPASASVRPAALIAGAPPPKPPLKKVRKPAPPVTTDAPSSAAAAAVMPLPPPASPPPATVRPGGQLADGVSLGAAHIDDFAPTPPVRGPKAAPKVVPKPVTSVASDTPLPAKPHGVATATGNWRVQLGAYGSEDRAATQWKALTAKVPALAAYRKTTEPVGAVVRLQAAGLPSKEAATALCKSVADGGGACFVVPQ